MIFCFYFILRFSKSHIPHISYTKVITRHHLTFWILDNTDIRFVTFKGRWWFDGFVQIQFNLNWDRVCFTFCFINWMKCFLLYFFCAWILKREPKNIWRKKKTRQNELKQVKYREIKKKTKHK